MSLSISVRLGSLLAMAATGLSLIPAQAFACPVCYGASDARTLHAFYLSTAAMTLMPLMLIGGFAIWISRAYGKTASHRRPPTASTQSPVER